VTAAPIPALRALPAHVLSDLARGLRSGRLAAGASRFMIRYAFPDIGEPGAEELAALFENGLGFEHAALLLEVVAAERARESDRQELNW
jgi:hypothetical protein